MRFLPDHLFVYCMFENQAMEEEGAPWEFLYNIGTALVQPGEAGDVALAERCLEQAEEVCREVRVAHTGRDRVVFLSLANRKH